MAASSSDSDSSSSRSTSPEAGHVQKPSVKAKTEAKKDSDEDSSSDSDSDSASDSGSDSSSEPESESESSDEMDTSEDVAEKDPKAQKHPVKAFKAPAGFKPVQKQAPPSSKTSSLLSNLRGKQVVHITAPSFLPLSKVKEITMSKIAKGEPILSYEGTNYGIPAESFNNEDPDSKSLLVFDPSTQKYSRSAEQIPSYHIQELFNIPQPDHAAIEALRDTVKPPRPQPKNLKMRFRPSRDEPSFKVPPGDREERKRKHQHTDGDASQNAASPSRKKSKKHSSQENEEKPEKKSKKSHKDREEKKRKKSEKA
ncbi:hypothetical protein N7470_001937 [Penicillium chermesinum]|nr:hypothetical protein N7470_001937 [Penicillium chermesinum]